MAYRVEYSDTARKQLRKLDRSISRRVLDYLDEVGALDDPRSRGKALVGERAGIWRYRVGDCRILCEVLDSELIVLALAIAHRSEAYE